MALYHFTTRPLSRSSRNTVDALAYRAGCKLYDSRTGETFDYHNKPVQHVELLLPKDAPQWAKDIQELIKTNRQEGVQALCDRVEAAEKRIDARVWKEFEFSLHRELTEEQNMTLAREFVQDQLRPRGMLAKVNFHFEVDKKTGDYNPHCHVVVATRRLEEEEVSKTGFTIKKERDWDKREFLFELREQWANYSNFHLKLHGHDIQIDHRSNQERGIEMEPQPKRGRSIIEQARKMAERKTRENAGTRERNGKGEKNGIGESTESVKAIAAIELDKAASVTDKMQAFHDAQLRNLYRIIRNPDVILDIVTKHHATFMWADVQKKLHQYVDNAPLFERLENKLKQSNELVLLRMETVRDSSGTIQNKAIYTTRSMLKAEKSLIEQAEKLGNSQTHGVQKAHIDHAIAKANEELKEHGGLSQDQIKAIHHLVEEGQIKCVVGIAGAGKTTAIGVCHDIWSAEGYAVYGLAPTGKAAQNLEGSSLENNGIPSTTLHKFLKSLKEGRCQYNDKSVLVLDEAGMVDVERFEKLLYAVRQLGVKLIVVGDGAQLQPVEAGPAFRLVTEKLGRSELNTVIRQKAEWQKEATVLFGQQKTSEAIKKYEEKGCIHIVEEKLPILEDAISNKDYGGIVHLYEASHRVSSLIYREMAKDVQREFPELKNLYSKIKEHEDFERYLDWKDVERGAADGILQNAQMCRPILEARAVDTLKLALVLKDKRKDKIAQQERAKAILKECGLDHLIGIEKQRGQSVDVRQTAKEELVHAWHTVFKTCPRAQDPGENPDKSLAILAFSNRDVNDLNRQVRALLKKSGHLSKGEFTFKIKKEIEDDFGRKYILQEEKGFSKGDRIVFTKNKYWLGVKNGTMGTITEINNQKIQIKLDEGTKFSGKEISVAPNLNPYFDHGWAVTIHKSQGTTIDQTYVLASFEMNQNLTYVAMTRHREGVKLFGSSLDFWRPEKLPELLSKSGEKLSAADYLDADALTKIMKRDDHLITKFFQRMSNELEAMGAVTKQAFWNVADHFLGIKREKEIRVLQDGVREEVRAEELFKKESVIMDVVSGAVSSHSLHVQAQPQSQLLSQNMLQEVQQTTQSKNEKVFSSFSPSSSPALIEGAAGFLKTTGKGLNQKLVPQRSPKKEIVENALKANMADFADHVFASIGEKQNHAMSSSIEKRYGKKGEFSVNLQKGVWLSHKDSQLAGTPLHLLTQLKHLSPQEAVDYGASWARLSPEQLVPQKQSYASSRPQKEALEKDVNETKQKIERAQGFWSRGQAIEGTLAEKYLREHRKIEGDLPKDLLYFPAHGEGKSSLPCLMAAARSLTGDVTAVQLTFLDPITANKAQIPVPKRSFGSLTGSAVTIQACPLDPGYAEARRGEPAEKLNLHFIAEGIETALSLKEAGMQGAIKASLGLSNIKNLEPQDPNTHIIICADPDAPESSATKSLEKSVTALQERGFKVTTIKPNTFGEDFNDVLKTKGPEGIREILAKNLPKHFYAFMQNHIETLPQKDSHTSKGIEKKDEQPSLKNVKGSHKFTVEGKSFKEIVAHCEKRLHDALARDKQPLTEEHIKRFPVQAERTATFLLHSYERNERHPTQEEFIQFSLRAKYELHRIPEIRKELIKDWKDKDSFKENEGLRAHMIAERLAAIEGRLYLKAKQGGTKIPSNVAELAHRELKEHRAHTPKLAQELSQKYSLSENIAAHSAKDVLRYKEIHGQLPSEAQIANMIQVAQKLEVKDHSPPVKKNLNRFEVDYYQRHEGDLFFKHISCQKEAAPDAHLLQIQAEAKKSLETITSQIAQELIKMNQKEFSL
jgi:ATP-dependent exoDNAse (exonuclease V) alpha subunit